MNIALADEYAAWLRSWSNSQRTREARRSLAANRLRAWGGVEGITTENIQAWLGDYSGWSKATYYSHMKDFCGWLVATGRLGADPMEGVRSPRRPKSVPKPLAESEVARALAAADAETRVWMKLALLAGLRAHEVAKIRGEDVSETHIYVDGKGGVRATLPTHVELWAIAQDYPRVGYWFPTADGCVSPNAISQRVSKILGGIGATGSIHRFRHTYGTRLLRAGVNIRAVQKLMRHATLATTEGYIDVTDDELTDAIARLEIPGAA